MGRGFTPNEAFIFIVFSDFRPEKVYNSVNLKIDNGIDLGLPSNLLHSLDMNMCGDLLKNCLPCT